ncbi:MAG: PqqD family protein [Actinomycetota bacterium]
METMRVSDHCEWRAIEGEVVVLDLRTELYLSFNDTGAALWRGLAAGATGDELVERLVTAYEVEESAARTDVVAFLGELVALGLVESVEPDADPHG